MQPSLSMPGALHIDLSLLINLTVLTVIFVLFIVCYVILSSVLMYHWSAYGMRSHGILVSRFLFLFISVILFVIAGLALSYF